MEKAKFRYIIPIIVVAMIILYKSLQALLELSIVTDWIIETFA